MIAVGGCVGALFDRLIDKKAKEMYYAVVSI